MNSITVEKTLGDKYIIKVESESILECIQKISVFAEVNRCTCCGSGDLYIGYRKVTAKEGKNAGKTFEYYDFTCRSCGAKANLGMFQAGGVFLKEFKRQDNSPASAQMDPIMPDTPSDPAPAWVNQAGPARDYIPAPSANTTGTVSKYGTPTPQRF